MSVPHTRSFAAALCACLLLLPGCSDGITLRIEFRVSLGVSPGAAGQGATLTFMFVNEGDGEIEATGQVFEFIVTDASGAEIRRIDDSATPGRLSSGQSATTTWDQRDELGVAVPPGPYAVTVGYRAGSDLKSRSAPFTIG